MSATRARVNPELTVGDLWPHLVNLTLSEVIAPATWQSLVPLVPALPGPVVGFERPVNDPRPGEWGFPLPRWQRATALAIHPPACIACRSAGARVDGSSRTGCTVRPV